MPQEHSVTFSNIANVPMMMAFVCSQIPPKCPIVHHMCHFMTSRASHCHHGPVFASSPLSSPPSLELTAGFVGHACAILRMWHVKNVTQCSYLCFSPCVRTCDHCQECQFTVHGQQSSNFSRRDTFLDSNFPPSRSQVQAIDGPASPPF